MNSFEQFHGARLREIREDCKFYRSARSSYRAAHAAGLLWADREYAETGERFSMLNCYAHSGVYLSLFFSSSDSLESIAQWLRQTRTLLGKRSSVTSFDESDGTIRYEFAGFDKVRIVVIFHVAHSGRCEVTEESVTITKRKYSCRKQLESSDVEESEGKSRT